ncbi:MAG: NAD-dependent epimerase/dehydratase family protein [Chloroflexi bacterium]|nr:NAD-dependent epimerase/dehydratase family protein [Chloroflexota bacterium]
MTKRLLVTGGAGFIGSALVDRLVELGFPVSVVDNLSTGKREHVSPKAAFYHMDIRDPDMPKVLQEQKPQIVCHLAAQMSVSLSVRDPIRDAEENILGSLFLLQSCLKYGVEKVIYASSGGAVYGEPEYLPCDEAHPIHPLAPYGASKYVVEAYLDIFRHLHGLDYTVLRLGNVYGPRQDPYGEAGVVAIFAKAMLEGKSPQINGTGEQERDFLYVSDAVEAWLLALELGQGQVYNIGSGQGASVNQIYQHLKSAVQYQGEAIHGPAKAGEVFKIHLDVSKARAGLGWKPRVPLEEGLRLTVEYFKANDS